MFKTITLSKLHDEVDKRHESGWRFVQLLGVNGKRGVDLVYSFMKDGKLENLKVKSVTSKQTVPSITDKYLAAFVFENETHDLFGVNIKDIAIDFKGKFYNVAQDEPMTIISPEVKAREERLKKVKEAKKNG
ncbi:MAG: NADH-quinone oxidoreductase subunit C [Coriobacteriia bacterium]|nr:NADH-quinone oxidoreductase subunit C [Coriobacteriia bacterium]